MHGEGGDVLHGGNAAEAERLLHGEFDSPFDNTAILVISGLRHAADSFDGRADVRAIMAPLLSSHAVTGTISPGNSLPGLSATIITPIPEHGVGEIAYVQGGTRYSAPAREETGMAVGNGKTVVITRVVGTQFYVRQI